MKDDAEGGGEEVDKQTSSRVGALQKLIDEKPHVPLFQCFVDPQSFGQSVENLFHLAFLVKNGSVEVKEDKGDIVIGILYVEITFKRPSPKARRR